MKTVVMMLLALYSQAQSTDTVDSRLITRGEQVDQMKDGEKRCVWTSWYLSKEGHVWLMPDGNTSPTPCRIWLAFMEITKSATGYSAVVAQSALQEQGTDAEFSRFGWIRVVKVEVRK